MYSDKKKKKGPKALALLVLLLLIAGGLAAYGQRSGREMGDESAQAIERAIMDRALQCYVVEGVYPPNLEYLTENYGLTVNQEDFYITYEAFASNLPPNVRVDGKAS